MLKSLILGFVIIIAIFLVVAAFQPGQFHIERSVQIHAAPETIFNQINDFHKWGAWSPWAKMDPEMQVEFTGKQDGIGAVYSWNGSSKVGAGKMEILTSLPSKRVDLKIEFFKPIKGENLVEFVIKPAGTPSDAPGNSASSRPSEIQTVTWTMTGPKPFLSKAAGLILNLDKIVGSDFERGLEALKQVCETNPAAPQK